MFNITITSLLLYHFYLLLARFFWIAIGWYLTDANGQPVSENVSFTEDNGYITIEAPYCGTDRYVTALFEKDPNESAVSFVYDPSGQNRYSGVGASFERIGRVLAINANADNVVTVPARSVDGYLFKGWYTNPALTEAATFDISDYKMTIPEASSKRDYTFYAKYERPEYELVTVDFMYQTSDGTLQAISSVPVFQPEDVSQYQIQVLKGQGYSGWVKLPANLNAYAPLRLLNADKMLNGDNILMDGSARIAEADGDRFQNGNTEVWIDAADGTKHYVMLYESDAIIGDTVDYSLKFVYGNVVLATPPETLTFPKGVTPQLNLSADMFKLDGYYPTSYSSALNANGNNVITVKYAPRSYILSFNTGEGSYVAAKTVPNGAALSGYKSDATPTRTGYAFDGWENKLYKTGTNTEAGTWNGTMPAYNVEARAKWKAANVNYTVLFWYENANDDKYSYMGSVSRSALTGSTVSSNSFSGYSGVTGASWIDTKHFTYNTSNVQTETVKADSSTVLSVYFKRNTYTFKFTVTVGSGRNASTSTIHQFTAKYQQDISELWTFTGSNGVSYPQANPATSWTPSGSSVYTARITRMEIMPDENISFAHTTTSYPSHRFCYYVESLGNGAHTYGNKKFDVYLDYNIDFMTAYYNDDFFLLNGFERLATTKDGKAHNWGTGDTLSLGSRTTATVKEMCFYYTRNRSV